MAATPEQILELRNVQAKAQRVLQKTETAKNIDRATEGDKYQAALVKVDQKWDPRIAAAQAALVTATTNYETALDTD